METTGTIKAVFDTHKVSDRFQKREIVLTIEEDPKYPQHGSFLLTQDKCELVNDKMIGSRVKVQFNLRGREWKEAGGVARYFNSMEIWKLDKI